MSLREELHTKQKKRYSRRWWLFLLILCVVGARWYRSIYSVPEPVEPESTTVMTGDILVTLDAEGRIRGNDQMILGFPLSEELTAIYVEPGDTIQKGQVLAKIDPRNYQIQLRRANNGLAQARSTLAQANSPLSYNEQAALNQQVELQKLAVEQARQSADQRISTAASQVQTAQANLEQLRKDLDDVSQDDDVDLSVNEKDKNLENAEKAYILSQQEATQQVRLFLDEVDVRLGASPLRASGNNRYEYLLSAKNTSLRSQAVRTWKNVESIYTAGTTYSALDGGLDLIDELQAVLQYSDTGMELDQATISGWTSSVNSRESRILQLKSALKSQELAIEQTKLSTVTVIDTVDDAQQDQIDALQAQIRTAQITYDQAVTSLEQLQQEVPTTIASAETLLAKTRLDTANVKKPLSASEKRLQELNIANAAIGIDEATYLIEKTTMVAPSDATVISVANVVGEYPSPDFIKLAIQANRYIEVLVGEEEVIDIYEGQKVSFALDALPESIYIGSVYYISPTGTRDQNDIVQYEVLIDFDDIPQLRSEMTVNVDFIQEQAQEVYILPVSYIVKKDGLDGIYVDLSGSESREDHQSAQKNNSKSLFSVFSKKQASSATEYQRIPVGLGLSDGEYVHVLEGVGVGDVVYRVSEEEE